jgi:hypothetical protein
MHYFDYETVAGEARIPADKMEQLVRAFNREEPHDAMLAELHILRACMAIKNGRLTVDQALVEARKIAA